MNTISDTFNERTCTVYSVDLGDTHFMISDLTTSLTVPFVLRELAANGYGLNNRIFRDGDVILDIGANVGVVSIFLAKQLPNVTIYAYEPASLNFNRLLTNLNVNNITNVVPINKAVTADGRDLSIHYNTDNLGGASAFMGQPPWQYEEPVQSVTLESIFEEHGIDRVALLKLDVEGAEHEIIAGCNGLLDRVDFLAMEAHFSPKLRRAGHNEARLMTRLRPLIQRNALQVMMLESPV